MFDTIVEFCISNLAKGSYKSLEQLEKDPNIDIIEHSCLNFCTRCEKSLYALVDGQVVKGENADELVRNIYQHIDANAVL